MSKAAHESQGKPRTELQREPRITLDDLNVLEPPLIGNLPGEGDVARVEIETGDVAAGTHQLRELVDDADWPAPQIDDVPFRLDPRVGLPDQALRSGASLPSA